MKTLVIHPKDYSTDFLKPIYEGKGYDIIDFYQSPKKLKEQMRNYDKIMMMGHGTSSGLLNVFPKVMANYIIDASFVDILKDKECVYIWCNADNFVRKYNLKGFYTGMIISEMNEAFFYSIKTNIFEITESNKLFASCVKTALESEDPVKLMKESYISDKNPVIMYNSENIYSTQKITTD